MMLKDSTAIETLARENATLFEKMADWLRDFFDKIREAFAGVEAVHAEARALMEADADGVMRYIDGLQALWDRALVDAARNVQGAQESQGDAKSSHDNVRYAVRDGLLTPESTEAERYELLENIKLKVAQVNNDRIADVNLEDYNTRKKSSVEKGIKKLAAALGITNVDLENSWIDFPFSFTNKNLGISIHHQLDYGGTYQDYVKAMSCFDEIVENAVPIETHRDKKAGTSKADPDLKQVYVMMSAFREGKTVTPVQIEIKEYAYRGGKLYLYVALTKTTSEVVENGPTGETGGVRSLFSEDYTISLRQLIHNVNSNDYKFFKYIPDGFLNDEQLAAKERALREQDAEYAEYGTKRQARDADTISSREALANALETAAKNDLERGLLADYKKIIQSLNEDQEKLAGHQKIIRELSFKKGGLSQQEKDELAMARNRAEIVRNRLNRNDKKLLNLEATEALKAVVARERVVAERKIRKKKDRQLAEYRERTRDTLTRAALRDRIRHDVKALNRLLLNETDVKHVPEELKGAVAQFLTAFELRSCSQH